MKLLWISWKNIWRRKTRTILVVAALVAGVALLVTLTSISKALRDDVDVMLDEYGANIIITPKPSTLPLSYGSITVPGFADEPGELLESDLPKIRRIKNNETINIVAPKLLAPADIDGNKILLVGVRFKDELALKKWWKLSGAEPKRPDEVIAGSKAASKLNKSVGDRLRIRGRDFKIAAVLNRIGSQEDDIIYANLATVQNLYGKTGKLSMVEVAAWCQTCPIEIVMAQISAKMPWSKVTSFKEVVASKANTLKIIDRFTLAIGAVVVVIEVLVVTATMLASVNQRVKEIGILRAIGYRKKQVIKIILNETFIVCLISGIIGWLLGTGAGKAIASQITGPRVTVPWNAATALTAVGLAALIGMVSGYFPARQAAHCEPQEALKAF